MRSIVILAIAAIAATAGAAHAADASTWKVDPVHSSATFTATHLGISHVNGIIPITAASVTVPDGSNIPSAATASLDPSGIDTRVPQRDADLRSAHFFDVANFPKMEFASRSIAKIDGTHFTMTGDLTMHGQTHPTTMTCEFLGRGPGMRPGEMRVAYACKNTIDRTQWGMNQYYPVVSNTIDLEIDVEAIKQ